jgi:hypothetical protein
VAQNKVFELPALLHSECHNRSDRYFG